jgi:hypothetical protein
MDKLRPLVIDDAARAQASAIVSFAEWHPFMPGRNATPPGDVPEHVGTFGDGYRAVFSFTHVDGVVYRHLSVSVPGGLYPNPIAALMLADLFGFTGWDGSGVFPESWTCRRVEEPVPCIAILEPVRMTVPAKERN